jgi:hypothetical protein
MLFNDAVSVTKVCSSYECIMERMVKQISRLGLLIRASAHMECIISNFHQELSHNNGIFGVSSDIAQ